MVKETQGTVWFGQKCCWLDLFNLQDSESERERTLVRPDHSMNWFTCVLSPLFNCCLHICSSHLSNSESKLHGPHLSFNGVKHSLAVTQFHIFSW